LIIVRTHIAYGSPNKQDTADAHGAPLGRDEVIATKKAMDWPLEPAFYIPEDALKQFRAVVDKGAAEEAEWQDLLAKYRQAFPDLAAQWDQLQKSPLLEGWQKHFPSFRPGDKLATRQASGKVINAVAQALPTLMGGSGDLAPSTLTLIDKDTDFTAANPAGRNLRFGVREHAMGAILNGMAATGGIIPYGATFLTFSDYMRAPIRLAALMDLGVIYVMTHDSVGLGEDGPTHQPVEHLAALRAIPNLVVLRPADATETVVAWRVALERRHGPTLLALTRQKLPILDRSKLAPEEGVAKGAYILSSTPDKKPQVILIATGSEVHLALKAQEKLTERGVASRVVSMPSWELFEAQPFSYREEVLPATLRARVAVEAGASMGWHKYIGPQGALVTLDRFGGSSPGEVALDKLGFNVDNVVSKALSILSR
jgi:transketolase